MCAVKSDADPEKVGVAAFLVGLVSRESVVNEVRLVLVLQGSLQFGYLDSRRRKGLAGRGHSMNRHVGTQRSRLAGRTSRRRAWMDIRPVEGGSGGRPVLGRVERAVGAQFTSDTVRGRALLVWKVTWGVGRVEGLVWNAWRACIGKVREDLRWGRWCAHWGKEGGRSSRNPLS